MPSSINVPSSSSTGSYTISWGSSSGNVTAYKLYEATNSGFSGQTLIYSGTGTSKARSGQSDGAYYYRVRACNGSSCSAYRTGANPTTVTLPPAPPASKRSRFAGRGRRETSPAPGTESTGTDTTQFLYDGDRLVAEYDGNGNLERRYVHGPGADEPVLWYEGAGLASPRGLFANHQGSIVAVADASGAALTINGYDAWGVPNPGNLGRFQYTGQAWLTELGLYHYKARVYSPGLGRFLQTDPVGYDDQLNLYAYVANDPINLFDPNGKERKGLFAALLDNTSISVGLSFGVNAEVSTPMGGVAIGTGEISLSGSTTLSGTDQMEVTTRPPHVGAHLGGPGIGMPTVTTTVTDRDDSTGADRFREEWS